jgi:hypothetical protein
MSSLRPFIPWRAQLAASRGAMKASPITNVLFHDVKALQQVDRHKLSREFVAKLQN